MDPKLLELPAWLVALFVFVAILLFIWFGGLFRKQQLAKGKEIPAGPLSPVEMSMLNLMGLMLAFTFGMALTKFESRRRFIIDETNFIETAILRCDLYPDSARSILRKDLANYIDSRIAFNNAGANKEKIQAALEQTTAAYNAIWQKLSALTRNPANQYANTQMIPVITTVINLATTREGERRAKVPPVILIVLFILVLTGSFLVGFNQSAVKRSKVFMFGFAFMTTFAVYLILELERPWSGLINSKSSEQRIVTLKERL